MVSRLFLRVLFSALISVIASSSKIVYTIQPGTPIGIQNFVLPEAGCNWAGVGGQVFDRIGSPVSGLIVKINGTIEGNPVLVYAVTGSSLQLGAGGYDVFLSDHPIATQSLLFLQLFDVTGVPLSSTIPLETVSSCTRNLLLVNLVEKSLDFQRYLPFISR
jgi:hypothetical protein